jgi:hypothetical protein
MPRVAMQTTRVCPYQVLRSILSILVALRSFQRACAQPKKASAFILTAKMRCFVWCTSRDLKFFPLFCIALHCIHFYVHVAMNFDYTTQRHDKRHHELAAFNSLVRSYVCIQSSSASMTCRSLYGDNGRFITFHSYICLAYPPPYMLCMYLCAHKSLMRYKRQRLDV